MSGVIDLKGVGEVALHRQRKVPSTKDPVAAAEQFEALLVHEMLKSMWNTVPKGELLSGSSDERTYRDMMNEALATSIASGRGIGVKDVILREMRQQEARANSSSPTVVGDDDDGNGRGE